MRTVRCSNRREEEGIPACTGAGGCVFQHALAGGVSQHAQGGVCLGVSTQEGVCLGVSGWGVSAQEGVSAQGVPHPPRQTTHPVNRITDACENITLLQLRCGR